MFAVCKTGGNHVSITDLKPEINEQALQYQLLWMRRHLHQNPELSWGEYETSRLIIEKLRAMGLEVKTGLAQTGFYTDISSGRPGPCLAWRADMDALPIEDEKDVPYKSQRAGIAHMCGHDVHTTVAFGIVKHLLTRKDDIRGTIRVFWQPAEEQQPSGSPEMIRDGVLEGVHAVYGMHCDPNTESGKISLRPGAETAAFDAFQFEIDGGSTNHSARPHRKPDAMWVGHQLVQNIYQFAGRMINVLEPTVVSVCKFNAGNALNVIPRQVYIGGTVRTVAEDKRDYIKDYLKRLADNLAELHGVKISSDFGLGAPAVVNHPTLYAFAKDYARETLGPDKVVSRPQSMGAEDFAFYSSERPGLFIRVGTSNGPATSHPLHSSLFDIDESILAPSAIFLANLLIRHTQSDLQF
ncbi:amidohydrolase [Cyclonatronum proteinivorum]|uniref:Amidohydrolase n=1 Tax=Cyclonatronum proteinivorum TaxID=1457365 RepID=A0A345UGP4_9BACT|nr:amidohydrolase [Cyclonatronum proteinivorum]